MNTPYTPSARKPLILLCPDPHNTESAQLMCEKLEKAGAQVHVLNNYEQETVRMGRLHRDAIAREVRAIDGLIVLGNDTSDIDPEHYLDREGKRRKERRKIPQKFEGTDRRIHQATQKESFASEEIRARALLEPALIKEAVAQGVPLLGICAGMQRINVVLGGSLHQHVPDLVGHDEHSARDNEFPPGEPAHEITIRPGSKLAGIAAKLTPTRSRDSAPKATIPVNSRHHQAVKDVAEGLTASAYAVENNPWASGSVIEAIESLAGGRYHEQFIMGVQFHPEYDQPDSLGTKLVERMVNESRRYMARKNTHWQAETSNGNLRNTPRSR